MKLANLKVKPIALYLNDDEKWRNRWEAAKQHFSEVGIEDIYWLNGIHGEKFQIKGTGIYILDNKEKNIAEQFNVGIGNTANSLSQYAAFLAMDILFKNTDYEAGFYLEDDARFVPDWKEKTEQAIRDLDGIDWDWLFIGSCCAKGKGAIHVKGDVYEFPYRGEARWGWYPACTHAYIVKKRCIEHLIQTNRDTSNPSDLSIIKYSFPAMKVFAVLPRLADQFNTEIPD